MQINNIKIMTEEIKNEVVEETPAEETVEETPEETPEVEGEEVADPAGEQDEGEEPPVSEE